MTKWYELERDSKGVPYLWLYLKALAAEPFVWIAVVFGILALASRHN